MSDAHNDIDARMQAAGMIPIADHLAGKTPMGGWMVHAGMHDLDTYETWLEQKAAEYLRMQAHYELGDRDKGDDMYDWTIANAGAYLSALLNLRAARGRHGDGQ